MECPYAFSPVFFPSFLNPVLPLFLEQGSLAPHLLAKVNTSGVSVTVYSCACSLHVPLFVLVPLAKSDFVSNSAVLKPAQWLELIHPFWKTRIVQNTPVWRVVLKRVKRQWDAFVILIQCKRLWRNLLRIKAIKNIAGAFLFSTVHAFAAKPAHASLFLTLMKSIWAEGIALQWTIFNRIKMPFTCSFGSILNLSCKWIFFFSQLLHQVFSFYLVLQ